jgi:hypothetical protein
MKAKIWGLAALNAWALLSGLTVGADANSLDPWTAVTSVTGYADVVTGTTYAAEGGAVAFVSPYPYVAIEASDTAAHIGDAQGAVASFTYYFEVAGPAYDTPVNVFATTDLLTQVTGAGYGFVAIDFGTAPEVSVCTGCAASEFHGSIGMTALAGNEYEVHFYVEASVNTAFGGTAFASADPFIFVAPNDPNVLDSTILLSDGVGNGLAPTPLPAALPLFATGLGAVGLFGRRRKRKNTAFAAA